MEPGIHNIMKKMLYFIFVLTILSACNKGKSVTDEETILKHTVIQYNMLLAEGYRNFNMSELRTVATEERAMKAYYHMSALGEGREKMDAQQKSISFEEIKFLTPDSAELKTREEWDYKHINIDTGETKFVSSIRYDLKYTLMRNNSSWLVSDIQVEGEETTN